MLNYKIDEQNFWTIFNTICDNKSELSVNEFLSKHKFNFDDFMYVEGFFKSINHPLSITNNILKPLHQESINMNFSLQQWVSFQACFPHISKLSGNSFFDPIKNKLAYMESENSHVDIFNYLNQKEELTNITRLTIPELKDEENKIVYIEESIIDKQVLSVSVGSDSITLLPLKLLFIGGHLELIGEVDTDSRMSSIRVSEITQLDDSANEFASIVTDGEFEQFICHLREIEDQSFRLVLKIYSLDQFEAKCHGEMFLKSCMFANPEGENIWAATIEPSNAIFEWIMELGSDVEILSPNTFKEKYLKYCEEKIDKIA